MESGIEFSFNLAGRRTVEFLFELCVNRDQRLGNLTIDQWWMPVTELYAQRKRKPGHNHREVLRLYWEAVRDSGETAHRPAQERFLLATIVPIVRGQGSRTIFCDAFLSKPSYDDVANLESMLSKARHKSLTHTEFQDRSWKALGREKFEPCIQDTYDELSHQLLDKPCEILKSGQIEGARISVEDNWNRLDRTIGRRARRPIQKAVLDVLSYEARAAFHHCYSMAFAAIRGALAQSESWQEEASRFHQFWHESPVDPVSFVSFLHGHVFALHPLSGTFMRTETGQELLGSWLTDPESSQRFGQLLNGLLVALFDYDSRRGEQRLNRRRREHGSDDLDQFTTDDLSAS